MAFKSKYTGSQVEELLDKAGSAIQTIKTIDGHSILGEGNISISNHNKGYHLTEDGLFAAYPNAENGDIAYVGSNFPFIIYRWDGSGWVNTGVSGGSESVDLNNYTTIENVNQIFASMFVAVGSEEELREMLEYGDYDANKIYYVVEE